MVKREELFIVTKIADIHHDRIEQSLNVQLQALQLDYTGKTGPTKLELNYILI